MRWITSSNPCSGSMPYRAPALIERFAVRYEPEPNSGCWLWLRARKSPPQNYGVFGVGSYAAGTYRQDYAHRLSYILHHGHIPDGMCVLHRCDNPPCVNPDHLFLGTHNDNVQDKIAKNRDNFGERNGQAKISASDVQLIRESTLAT